MAEPESKSVLARKCDLARSRGPRSAAKVDHGPRPATALVRAVKRAGMAYEPLEAEPRDEAVLWDQTLAEVTAALPEGGLTVVLEGEDRVRGLMHLHQGLLDALIEVQTTGQVDSVEGQIRTATRIDGALSRDFIDLVLSAFDNEMEELGAAVLLPRLSFGTLLTDRRQLPLLLPEHGFHMFRANVNLAGGTRLAQILLALPGRPAPASEAAADPARTGQSEWQRAFRQTVAQARVPFRTILFRTEIGMHRFLRLQAGDMIPFSVDALDGARLEDGNGRNVMRGRLGQSGGRRAVRLSVGAVDGPHLSDPAASGRKQGARAGAATGGLPALGDEAPAGAGGFAGGLDPAPFGSGPGDTDGADDFPDPGTGLPPLGGDGGGDPGAGLPPLGEGLPGGDGLPDLGGGLPPLGGDGLPDLGGGLPPLGGEGLPDLGGGLPPLGGEGLPELGDGLPDLGSGLPDLPKTG
ncbi:hypothetical protein HKCCE2091_15380 [Rhodobacterales bacterium HKCCE2091]|nr:hypothetical protein [Rhodobacterales bacterium HKCCE2091]